MLREFYEILERFLIWKWDLSVFCARFQVHVVEIGITGDITGDRMRVLSFLHSFYPRIGKNGFYFLRIPLRFLVCKNWHFIHFLHKISMKNLLSNYLAGMLSIMMTGVATAQWQDITANLPGTPSAGDQASLMFADNELYVLGETGVYRSSNGGSSFSTINAVAGVSGYNLGVSRLRFVKKANSFIYVGDARNDGSNSNNYTPLHRLSAGQTSWTQASQVSLPDTVFTDSVEDVAYDSGTGAYYAASNFAGCYYSADGLSWQERRVGLPTQGNAYSGFFANATSVLVRDGKVFLTVQHPSLGGVYTSTDQAQTWTRTNVPSSGLARLFAQDGRVMVAASGPTSVNDGTWLSDDNGVSWERRPFLNLLSQIRGNGSLLVATPGYYGAQDLRFSVTRGDTWDELDRTGLPADYIWRAIEPSGTDLYLIGYAPGVQNMKVFKRPISQFNLTPAPQFLVDADAISAGFTRNEGAPFSVSIGAAPAGTVSYIWRKDGVILPSQTGATLSISSVAFADVGSYTVEIIGGSGSSGVSEAFNLSVLPSTPGNGDTSFAQADSGRSGTLVLYDDFRLLHADGDYLALYGADGKFLTKRSITGGTLNRGFMDSRGNLMLFGGPTIVRINPDTLASDASFAPPVFSGSGTRVHDAIELPGRGYLLALEAYTSLNGVAMPRTALFDYSGNYVTTASFAGAGRRLLLAPDGKIYVGQSGIQRMFSNGVMDPTFSSTLGGGTFVLHPEGSIICGAGSSASPLRKLNPDGSEDTGFTSRIPSLNNGSVGGLIIEPSGKILVYGSFKKANDVNVSCHYRLNADGTTDTPYNAVPGYMLFGTPATIAHVTYDPRGSFFFLPSAANVNFTQIGRLGLAKVFADRPGINLWKQPVRQSVASGGSAILRAGVTGTSAISYQWYKDGVLINGATSSTLTLSGFNSAQSGRYSFVATNASGTVTSDVAIVDLIGAPVVVNLSKPVVANEGTPLNLSVTVSGDPTFSYQWTKNGTPIPAATGATYSISTTFVSDSGDYRVIITNGIDSTISDPVSVVFQEIQGRVFPGTETPAPAPGLYALAVLPDGSYLVGGAHNYGKIAFYHISASGQIIEDGWTALGQPNFVSTVKMIELNRAQDRVYVASSGNTAGSVIFQRYFLDGTIDSSFAPAAASTLMAERPDGSLWVASETMGTAQLSLLSESGALMKSVSIPAISSSVIKKIIPLGDGSVLVGGAFRDVSSSNSTAVKGLVRILADGNLDEDFPNVLVNTSVMDMARQSSGKIVAGLSNNTLVRFSNDGVMDTTFDGTVLPSGSILNVEIESDDRILVFGAYSFYRRMKDGAADASFVPMTDFTAATYRAVRSHPSGRLYVVGSFTRKITNAAATTAILTTNSVPVFFTEMLTDSSGELGGSATFTPAFYSDGAVTFQWFRNGVAIPGATSEILTLNDLTLADGTAAYTLTITHASGAATSTPASLKVFSAPEIITHPLVAQTVDKGAQVFLSVSVVGKSPLAYQWKFDGQVISGATSATFSIPAASLADSGCYTVDVSNTLGVKTSAKASVSVQIPYGNYDTTINLTPNSPRRATAVVEIPGGGYYAGGNFSTINGIAQAGIVKVSDSGQVLPFAVSGITLGANFNDIDIHNGKILYATNAGYGRINADGTLDSAFPNSATEAKCLLVVGDILYVAVQTPGQNNPRMRKIDLLTNIEDTVFAANFAAHQASASSSTSEIALLTTGKIAFGGTRNNWGIINPDGTLVSGFTNIFGNPSNGDPTRDIFGVTAAPGGKIYLSGSFYLGNGTTDSRSIARLNGDGSLDPDFRSTHNATLKTGILDGDGIVVRGISAGLTRFDSTGAVSYPTNGGPSSVNHLIKDSKSRAVYATTGSPLIGRVQLDTGDPFLITCQPSLASTPVIGKPVSLGVAWSGVGPVTYQWNKNGVPISGASSQAYTIPRYDPALHEGTYTVTISGGFGSLTTTGQPLQNGDPIADFYTSAGIPLALQTDSGDYDNDGVPNLIEYLYGSNPAGAASTPYFSQQETSLSGAAINVIAGAGLDPTHNYYVVEIRLPKNKKGLNVTTPATIDLVNFGNGSASMNAFGPVIDDGDFTLQRHYSLPSIQNAPKAFWRVEATR